MGSVNKNVANVKYYLSKAIHFLLYISASCVNKT